MTLEEAIKHAEATAIENEKEAKRKRERGGWYYDSEARACAICAEENRQFADWLRELQERRDLPEIIFCKDCVKHNVDMRESLYIEKDQECPLIRYRGKARGHEFDYQYCAFAERRTDG